LETYSGAYDRISAITNVLSQLNDNNLFNENHWRDLWKNNRFENIIRSSSDDQRVLGNIFQMGCQSRVPDYIPEDIAKKLNKLREDETDIDLPEIIENFEKFAELLREMRQKSKIPKNFRSVLTDSIEKNKNLLENLEKLEILKLFKWDFQNQIFPEAIETNRIVRAVEIIDKLEENESNNNKPIDVNHLNLNFNEEKIPKKVVKRSISYERRLREWTESTKFNPEIHQNLIPGFGDINKLIDSKEFVRLSLMIEKPNLNSKELTASVTKVKPYIIQRIKMWGCQALTADNISRLISAEENFDEKIKKNNVNVKKTRFGKKATSSTSQTNENVKIENKVPLSRLDIIVGIINSVDCIVAQDLLNIMAKFPIALPLIIRELHDEYSFKV
jgi:hypothetical protein